MLVVVDRRHYVVGVPEPVFVPRELVAQHRAVCAHRVALVGLLQLRAVGLDAAHVARDLPALRKLVVLYLVGDFVGNYLPALAPVVWYGVGIKIRNVLPALLHVLERLFEQLVHEPHVRVLGVGADAREAAHLVGFVEYAHLHRVDRGLRYEHVVVEPAYDVGLLHRRELRVDDFLLLPADGVQLLVRHLKDVAEQRVVLLHVLASDRLHLQIFLVHDTPLFAPVFCLSPGLSPRLRIIHFSARRAE